jgi:chromosome segregation ATPase
MGGSLLDDSISPSASVSVTTASHSEDDGIKSEYSGILSGTVEGIRAFDIDDNGAATVVTSDDKNRTSQPATSTRGMMGEGRVKLAEFTSLKNAIKMINLEAIKAEELYRAESMLLQKANQQLIKFSHLLQEQDAQLAATEEALSKERKQRESAEKHFVKLKKMMVVKDVEVSEADQRKKSEVTLRKGAEKEMTTLRRQLQAKESLLTAMERKYHVECKRREKFESQMMELSIKAGKQSAEEKYQILQQIRAEEPAEPFLTNNDSSYDKWKHKGQEDSHKAASLMAQLNDVQEQLKHTEQDLEKANERFHRERQLREEADKQVIVMREKGFAYHIDRRSSARAHAEDCLNTERLKLRNTDLQEQYELLKTEARNALEKARDRVQEEKVSRQSLEEQLEANRQQFNDALDREKKEHKKKMEELAQKVTEARTDIERAKSSTNGNVQELEDLRRKDLMFQEQIIEARAESKKEQALRAELRQEMKAMEDELDSMEIQLKDAKNEVKTMEEAHRAKEESLREELKATKTELNSMESQLRKAKHELKTLEETNRAMEDKYRQLESTHREMQEKNQHELDKQVKSRQEEITQMQSVMQKDRDRQLTEMESEMQKEREQQIKELEALVQKERDQRVAHENEIRKLRSASSANGLSQLEAKEKIKMLEEELAEVTARWTHLREKHQESEEELGLRVQTLEEELQALEARCKHLKTKYHTEQELKEKAKEEIFNLNQTIRQLTEDFNESRSQLETSEKQFSLLRQQTETVASTGRAEMRIKEQLSSLRMELEDAKDKCASLQQSLEQAELRVLEEKELRKAVEAQLSMDERSIARARREEAEQEIINVEIATKRAIRLAQDKSRDEKQKREKAEEQCRSLREEIHRLKHEQVVSNQNGVSSKTLQEELVRQIASLTEELELAESRRDMAEASLEDEKKLREDFEKQNQAFRDMIPEYAKAEEKYQKERRLRSEAEATVEMLQQKGMEQRETGDPNQSELQRQLKDLQLELQSLRSQREKVQDALRIAHERVEKEQHLREDAESQLQSFRSRKTLDGNFEVEKKLREKAEKQVMSMRLKMEVKESQIASLKSRLTGSQSSGNSVPSSRAGLLKEVDAKKSPTPLIRQLEYRSSAASYDEEPSQQPNSQGEEQRLRQEIMDTLPEYVKNNFGRIGFVKHSAFDYWPALVLDPFTVPHSIRTKWLELYYEVSVNFLLRFVWLLPWLLTLEQ